MFTGLDQYLGIIPVQGLPPLALVTKDLEVTYDLAGLVTKDLALVYDIAGLVTILLTVQYDINLYVPGSMSVWRVPKGPPYDHGIRAYEP